jgi:hypothetical protein
LSTGPLAGIDLWEERAAAVTDMYKLEQGCAKAAVGPVPKAGAQRVLLLRRAVTCRHRSKKVFNDWLHFSGLRRGGIVD